MLTTLLLAFSLLFWSGYTFKQATICVLSESVEKYKVKGAEELIPGYCTNTVKLSNFSQTESEQLIKTDTAVKFLSGIHKLHFQWIFSNLRNITITKANPSHDVDIHCSNSSGIVFQNIFNLILEGLAFKNCNSQTNFSGNIAVPKMDKIWATLVFLFGENVRVVDVNISNSTIALFMYDVAGIVDVYSVHVRDAFSNEKKIQSGNVIAYNLENEMIDTVLTIKRSSFAYSGYRESASCLSQDSFSYSSGLALFLYAARVRVHILDTYFQNNYGCNGGNMLLLLDKIIGTSKHPVLTMNNVTLENGSAILGGGLFISFKKSLSKLYRPLNYDGIGSFPVEIAFNISNCTFRNNYAIMDGGGIYLQLEDSYNLQKIYNSYIINSKFVGNKIEVSRNGGLAIHFKTIVESQVKLHQLATLCINLYILDSKFFGHILGESNKLGESRSSVILATSIPYLKLDGIKVMNNDFTAVNAVDTILLFKGSSVISNNIALRGAGIELCCRSLIYLSPHTNLSIVNNSATTTGGGIFVNSKCYGNQPMCFYQHTHDVDQKLVHTVNVTVKDNRAIIAGSNLFGGSIDYCYWLHVNHSNKYFKNGLNIPNNSKNQLSSISSNPQQVCFVSENGYDCAKKTERYIYPGQVINLQVRVVGQLNGSVPGLIGVFHSDNIVLYSSDLNKYIRNSSGDNISYTIISGSHKLSKQSVSLHLKVDGVGDSSGSEYTQSFPEAVVLIHFMECPIGFELQQSYDIKKPGYVCRCNFDYFFSTIDCSMKSDQMQSNTITKDLYSWIGVRVDKGVTYFISTTFCRVDYCNSKLTEVPISDENELLQDTQCLYNRTGIRCGSCQEGWSMMLGNSKCSNRCNNISLFLIIPFALAGLLLVFTISFLDLTVTVGTINGLIFYMNIMQDNFSVILMNYPVPIVNTTVGVLVAWFNLDLGIPCCFYRGMGVLGKTLLQGVFPVYLWLIVIIIIFLCKRSIRVTHLVGENAVKVLATLILLSYTKMLRVTMDSLHYSNIRMYNSVSGFVTHEIIFISDSVWGYKSFKNILIITITLLFFFVSFPFTMSLLCIKYIFSLSNFFKCLSFINKLKPFFDTYTGPFRLGTHYWPGLLLLFRALILIVQLNAKNYQWASLFTVLVCLILLAIMVEQKGVYWKQSLNIIECSFIFNIAVVSSYMTFFNFEKPSTVQTVVVLAMNFGSVLIALITFLCILVYHVYLKCTKYQRVQALIRRRIRRCNSCDIQSVDLLHGYDNPNDTNDEDEVMEADNVMNHFPPSAN